MEIALVFTRFFQKISGFFSDLCGSGSGFIPGK
jgi:hypothetical protein